MANLHPTGKRGVDDAIPAGPLGKNQERILRDLREHHYWSAGCGWIYGTYSRTVNLLESLIPRGLVVRTEESTGHTGVVASLYGKTRITYRPTYGATGVPQEPAKAPELTSAKESKQMKGYKTPDVLAHVYAFAYTVEAAQQIADEANRHGTTRNGKFIARTFVVSHIEGHMPAVTGTLTGK